MANPLDHPVDENPNIDVPGKLRAEAKKQRAAGKFRMAKDMEDEAKRVELKRKLATGTPGQRAVLKRMHARENVTNHQMAVALVVGGSIALGVVSWAYQQGKRR